MDAAACGRQDLREKESSVFQKLKSGDIFLYFFKPYRFVRAVFSTPAVTLSCRNIYPVTIEHLSKEKRPGHWSRTACTLLKKNEC
jgi:hypothetical protein